MSLIDFGDSNAIGLITIAGISYIQTSDGLRKATDEEIAANAIAETRKAEQKAAARAARPNTGISINFGDIAGGDIIKIDIKR
jgi:hypothetical protein